MKRISIVAVFLISFFFLPISTIICDAELGQSKLLGYHPRGTFATIPFAVILDSVDVSYSPYYLYVVNTDKKKPLPIGNPDRMDISIINGILNDWNIIVDTLIWSSSLIEAKDRIRYVEFEFTGGVPSAFVSAYSKDGIYSASGWVCCGNSIFSPRSLPLNGNTSIVFINHQVLALNSVIRLGVHGKIGEKQYHFESGKTKYIRGCYLTQKFPHEYEDASTGTAVFKIRASLWGIIVSRLYL